MVNTTLIIGNNIRVKNPNQYIWNYCKKNLTIPNPEFAKKQRMGFYTGNTPRQLELYTVDGDDIILPYGCLYDIQQFADEEIIDFREPEYVFYGYDVPLYDYQLTAVRNVIKKPFGILQSAAGSGKTQMGIAIIQQLGKRALWITHTKDLLNQSLNRAKQYIASDLIGTITEGKVRIGKGITFATVQTLSNIDLAQYKNAWDVIVVDECHRVAGTPTSLTMFYKVLSSLSAKNKYGLSATVHRADGMIKATYSILGPIIYAVPEEATASKTMKVTIQPVSTHIGLTDDCFSFDGTLKYTSMVTYLAENNARNELIEGFIEQSKGHSMLVLSSRLNQLRTLMSMLPEDMQEDAVMIDGTMTSKNGKARREQAIEDMRQGKKHILFASYGLAKEGLDIPRLDRLFFATPEKDEAIIIQSLGRIARTFEGKETPICYDFTDNHSVLASMSRKRYKTYKKQKCEVLPFE